MNDTDISILARSSLFSGLSNDEIIKVCEGSYPRFITLRKNELYRMKEKLCDIYILLSGRLSVIYDTGMTNSLMHMLDSSDCFGIAFCHDGIPCRNSLKAVQDSRLIVLSYSDMISVSDTRDRILYNLLSITSRHLLMLAEKIDHTQAHSVRIKLCVYFRGLMEHTHSSIFELSMNRNDLSYYLNVSYPAMIRELAQMQKEDILRIDGSTVTVKDPDALLI